MLALPERVPEPTPEQVLSHAELVALSEWKRHYNFESRLENAGMDVDEARKAGDYAEFVRWAYRTGRLGADDRAAA